MTHGLLSLDAIAERIAERRQSVAEIRQRARRLFDGGATGIQVAAAISEMTEAFVVELLTDAFERLSLDQQNDVQKHTAVVAVGGTGRGEMAPFSDVDLLFLSTGEAQEAFTDFAGQVVRDCWDAGIKLGHSVHTITDALVMARHEPQFATALVETRRLWGNEHLVDRLKRGFKRKIVHRRLRAFVADCLQARLEEREQYGSTICQLEPEVKRSLGGLRDIHVIRWIGFAHHATADIETLRLESAFNKDDARRLLAALEFLTKVRIDLHFAAGKSQDLLTREEQLRLADARAIEPSAGQRPVEILMQTYFRHSTAIADIADRFIARHEIHSVRSRFLRFVITHRAEGIYRVDHDTIDVYPRYREIVCNDAEQILRLYDAAALYGVKVAPQITDILKRTVPNLPREVSPTTTKLFLDIIKRPGHLGATLRALYETGMLELVLPEMAHTRCLLQFNQYHSYTVDEHTLRAVEAAQRFEDDNSPLGTAYRAIHQKKLLHLAILLHDAGKGYEEDHSEVGRRLAETVADRVHLPEHQRDALMFLVHKHLMMAHLAFRRDISDPEILLRFSHEVGSPEALRMLFVLTAADITAVGPGVWTDWKAELLTDLFDRAMLILSGKRHRFDEDRRLEEIKNQVAATIVPLEGEARQDRIREWIGKQLAAFTPHYLTNTTPAQIAADLDVLRQLKTGEIVIEGTYDAETGTVEYRVITDQQFATGCSHKIAGVLTANRLEILSAQITTSHDGMVVDAFRVIDEDHAGEVPAFRIDEVANAIRKVLRGETTVKSLFQRYKRFDSRGQSDPLSDLPIRVVIDNNSSERYTIIDVFAHDRPGLLYTILRIVFQLELSVMLAKIATHFDQVVDVFYVTDAEGRKIEDGQRLNAIRQELLARLQEFEQDGHVQFV